MVKIDGNKVKVGIISAMLLILGLFAIVGAITITPYFNTLVVGSIFQAGDNSGILEADSELYNLTQELESNYSANVRKLNDATGIGLNLVIIAVVLLAFGGLVAFGVDKYKKSKGNKGNMGV